MRPSVVLAIDQGTTGTRAILYAASSRPLASAYQEFRQHFPRPGWVEHDPEEIWRSVLAVMTQALKKARLSSEAIRAIGITNQRETTVLWERRTGRPVHPAIVWQDRRTASFCEALKSLGLEKKFRDKTGLVLDPYFSGTKIRWLLDHVQGLRKKAEDGEILFGTIDCWILWKLTGARSHATDYTNASRTLLFNIKTKTWDPELLRYLKIPRAILPKVQESGSHFGVTVQCKPLGAGIPIKALIGDQQAALYGQGCYQSGEAKNTYGTGCFLILNVGAKYRRPPFGLLTTLASDENGKPVYALEGAVFIGGAVIQWLRDGLAFFKKANETASLAKKVKDTGGVTLIPAFAGLGSPYWNPNVRGMMTGLTRGTKREHLIRAALESIAHQSADVLEGMRRGSGHPLRALKVDGGATANELLMQFQADLLGIPVLVSDIAESTAWGAAKLAAKVSGVWPSLKLIDQKRKYRRFVPRISRAKAVKLRLHWKQEIERLLFCPST